MAKIDKSKYSDEKVDKWFAWQGVRPPERQPHMTEDEIAQALKDNLAGHKCEWYQKGNAIECEVGASIHGKIIGTNVRLAGTTETGEPVLVPVGAIMRSDV